MPYIFSPDLVTAREQDLKAIHAAIATYYEGVERARGELLESVFHDRWLMKDTDNPEASSLNVEDKPTFVKRVRDHGPYAGYAEDRRVVSVGTAYDELAFVRVDKDSSRMCTCFFLFETEGGWSLVDKIWVNPRADRAELPEESASLRTVSRLVADYYRGLAENDVARLDRLLHPTWESKHLDDGALRLVARAEHLERVGASGGGTPVDFTRLLSVEVYQDGMAVARVDRPSSGETAFHVAFEIDGKWQLVNERRARARAARPDG